MQLCAEFHYRRRPLFRKRLSSLPDEFRRESTIFLRASQSWNRARECAATSFVVVVVRTPNKLHILCQVKLNLTLCQVSRTPFNKNHATNKLGRHESELLCILYTHTNSTHDGCEEENLDADAKGASRHTPHDDPPDGVCIAIRTTTTIERPTDDEPSE